jgi:DNA-binding Xre family transcriptional regulator
MKSKPVQQGYFKSLGVKYLLDSAKIYTGRSKKDIAKSFGISVNTYNKIVNQNTKNLANFKPSTFSKINKSIPKIDNATQLALSEIAKGLKKVNGRISEKNLQKLVNKADKIKSEKMKEFGRSLKGLYTSKNPNYIFYKALYEKMKSKK